VDISSSIGIEEAGLLDRLSQACAYLTHALHQLRRIEVDGLTSEAEELQTVQYAAKLIRQALGPGDSERAGLFDFLGMRVFSGWLDQSTFEGTYDGFRIYRYDTDDSKSLYSAKEMTSEYLLGEEASIWFTTLNGATAYLCSALGGRAGQQFQIAQLGES
jgi:hypothetical protein